MCKSQDDRAPVYEARKQLLVIVPRLRNISRMGNDHRASPPEHFQDGKRPRTARIAGETSLLKHETTEEKGRGLEAGWYVSPKRSYPSHPPLILKKVLFSP